MLTWIAWTKNYIFSSGYWIQLPSMTFKKIGLGCQKSEDNPGARKENEFWKKFWISRFLPFFIRHIVKKVHYVLKRDVSIS